MVVKTEKTNSEHSMLALEDADEFADLDELAEGLDSSLDE